MRPSANRVILTSFIVDFFDVFSSLVVTILSGSVIMFTQILGGLADLSASALLIYGLYRSQQQPDRSHPFGYGRELYFWTLLAVLVMFGITVTFSVYFGWQRVMKPEEVHNLPLAFVVLGITLLTNGYAFSLSYRRLLRDRSFKQVLQIFYRSSLVETKTTFILDLMGAIASFFGIVSLLIYKYSSDYRFDGFGAIIIGILLGILAIFLILGIKDLLVGRSASPETEERIRKLALSRPQVKEVLDLKTMHIGSERLLVNMEVNLADNLRTEEIEKLMDNIKAKVISEIPSVKHIQVELETKV